ncbi:hypothetical protein NliqN6_1442 [Naganishia liquefaciens]|uniref:Uncharacterized protein n=1 Tax=Naganishia liquefaciens TaxID=104408 RepID=A0A8H3TPX3_9TREE|nr:hypothetical protein NliqN6_1442 [Naganishia liquefaciens]
MTTALSSPKDTKASQSDISETSYSSFDPDSPLPTSRAPRHSLLLALTTSPLKFDETSPTKSPSNSPSPTRHELVFAPEYHNVTTPSRPHQRPMAVSATETPSGPATSRHRLARALRQEQFMIERQAAINDKLSAISLSMSGMRASFYGASSIGQPKQVSAERDGPHILTSADKQRIPSGPSTKVPQSLPVNSGSVSEADKPEGVTRSTVNEPITNTTSKADGLSQSENQLHASSVKIAQSRIPKPVLPPSQPVFRKPTISGLPTIKPSLLPTKTPDVPAKISSMMTLNYKATRPEAGHPNELQKYATPLKGRLTSSEGFRSPAATRVISASNPAKPIQSRIVSGNLTASMQGAVRPVTPGKTLNRSVSAQEGSSATIQREKESKSSPPRSSPVRSSSCQTNRLLNVGTVQEKEASGIWNNPRGQNQLSCLESPVETSSTDKAIETIRLDVTKAKPDVSKEETAASRDLKARDDASKLLDKSATAATLLTARRTPVSRATRAVRPIAAVPAARSSRPKARPASEPKRAQVAAMTAKELEMITVLNTSRNEVQFNTIDKRPLKKEGPRPPSPGCKTIAEKEAEEKKLGRGARARRRGSDRDSGDHSSDQDHTGRPPSLADLPPPLKHVRGAGEDEEYQTPARPLKRGRQSGANGNDPSPTAGPTRKKGRVTASKATSSICNDKFVRWEKSLIVIDRPEPSAPQHRLSGQDLSGIKSCLKNNGLIQLDHLGNLSNASEPIPKVRRSRVLVHQIWYDGEDPPAPDVVVSAVAAAPSAGSRRGKK